MYSTAFGWRAWGQPPQIPATQITNILERLGAEGFVRMSDYALGDVTETTRATTVNGYYRDLYIPAGVTFSHHAFILACRTLRLGGTLSYKGANAAARVGGVGIARQSIAGCAAGGTAAGGAGVAGGASLGTVPLPRSGVIGTAYRGGSGGRSNSFGTGGVAGVVTAETSQANTRSMFGGVGAFLVGAGNAVASTSGGSGGGSGASSGASFGGGGGASGGFGLLIAGRVIVESTGRIDMRGGDGADHEALSAGGGGGGGGGLFRGFVGSWEGLAEATAILRAGGAGGQIPFGGVNAAVGLPGGDGDYYISGLA